MSKPLSTKVSTPLSEYVQIGPKVSIFCVATIRAVRFDDIYRMDEIKSLSFHIMFYRLYCGVAKYIVSGNTFSSFE